MADNYFKKRFTEWLTGISASIWGLIALLEIKIFYTSPLFSSMTQIMPGPFWAYMAFLAGILKCIFLIVNGAWRRSAHLRTFGSIITFTIWSFILVGYLKAGYVSPNAVLPLALMAADIFSIWNSAAEAKRADIVNGKYKQV